MAGEDAAVASRMPRRWQERIQDLGGMPEWGMGWKRRKMK